MVDFEFKVSETEMYAVSEGDDMYHFSWYWRYSGSDIWRLENEFSVPIVVVQALNREIFKEELEKARGNIGSRMHEHDGE